MKEATTAVLFDLDSTLCSTKHRWPISPLNDEESSWEDYAEACDGDSPIQGTMTAMKLHSQNHQIHICSNRPNLVREKTVEWLTRHGVTWDFLNLAQGAPDGGREKALQWCAMRKADYIQQLQVFGVEPVLFYDDDARLAQIVSKETGVPFVIVNPAYHLDDGGWEGRG